MSAYICDRKHINYLVRSAMDLAAGRAQEHNTTFRWFHGREWHEITRFDFERGAEVANELWRENIKSVSFRYPNESSATLPGPVGESFVIEPDELREIRIKPNLAQIFKSCDCYEYQSCEHDTWEESEAFAFIQALRKMAWASLPGYKNANWGAPEQLTHAEVA